ncbi:transglycosylase SLT domain-containing protein [Zoogloea sp.]|uniref:lytic transglycosylase domain-containing protein n=1 Tax=Zoogloea sp. TaxID=49181 RepID=UPI0035AE734A
MKTVIKNSVGAVLAAALWCFIQPAQAEPGDERIIAAREAARTGDRKGLAAYASPAGHVLDPYPEYWALSNQIARPGEADPARVRDFLRRQSGSWLAEKLRGEWLRSLGKRADWSAFAAEYPLMEQPEQDLVCYQYQARMANGDPLALAEARALWNLLIDTPEACTPVLQALVREGMVGGEDLWLRLRRLVEARRITAAKAVAGWLPADSGLVLADLDKLNNAPGTYLDKLPLNFSVTRGGRELALLALARVARDDPQAAFLRFNRLDERFSGAERSYIMGQIAWQAAQRLMPEAHAWFKAADDAPMGEDQAAWRVRAALRAGDWRGVRVAVEAMGLPQRDLPDWQYWLARALQAQGQKDAARRILERIAGNTGFYPILAGEELGQGFSLPRRARPVQAEELELVRQSPGLQRALALFRLDMRTEGSREWNWSLRNRDDRFLLAAAQFGQEQGLYDRAIYAAERTRSEHDFALRYLMPFREHVEPNARAQGLEPGWVYGLIRQESRFTPVARSSVGAQGLMQIMPTTGQWLAGKLSLKGYTPGWLQAPDTNVYLGTSYMRIILDGLDRHPLLASAAYNAGPGRAKRWKAARPLEGAVYAETIPFNETRDYVKKVLANAVIYGALLDGKAPSLKATLGTVAPGGGGADNAGPGAGLE